MFSYQIPLHFSPYHTCHMPHAPPVWSYFIWLCNNIWAGTNEEAPHYVFIFLLPASTSSLLGPNIFHNNILSSTFSLCSSLIMTNYVSCPYKITGITIIPYILIIIFRWQTERNHLPEFTLLLIYSCMQFWLFSVFSKYLANVLHWKDLLIF
jgi:hypothetical protein